MEETHYTSVAMGIYKMTLLPHLNVPHVLQAGGTIPLSTVRGKGKKNTIFPELNSEKISITVFYNHSFVK